MALLDISEYKDLARDQNTGWVQCGVEPALASQQVAIGDTSTQSAAFGGVTRFVRLHCDVACRIAFGDSPTAAGTTMRMAAGQTEYFGVRPGHKVAVITTT